jgi:hypothetical protein
MIIMNLSEEDYIDNKTYKKLKRKVGNDSKGL